MALRTLYLESISSSYHSHVEYLGNHASKRVRYPDHSHDKDIAEQAEEICELEESGQWTSAARTAHLNEDRVDGGKPSTAHAYDLQKVRDDG